MHFAVLGFGFGGEGEAGFGCGRTEDTARGMAADLGPVLEAVT